MNSAATALDRLNALDSAQAFEMFSRCCGSQRWSSQMVARRPFTSSEHLLAAASEVDATLGREDWLEAFDHHPRIGDREVLRARLAAAAATASPQGSGWERGEQAGVRADDEQLLDELAAANAAYEDRFGFIFLICASGLDGTTMLARCHERMSNDIDVEWTVAAAEQAKISRLRLAKLLEELGTPTADSTPKGASQ